MDASLVNNLQSIALLIDCGDQDKHILCPKEKINELISLICQSEGHLSSLRSNIDRLLRLMNMRQKWLSTRRIGCNGEFKDIINATTAKIG